MLPRRLMPLLRLSVGVVMICLLTFARGEPLGEPADNKTQEAADNKTQTEYNKTQTEPNKTQTEPKIEILELTSFSGFLTELQYHLDNHTVLSSGPPITDEQEPYATMDSPGDESEQFIRFCKLLLTTDLVTRRVRRTTGRLPKVARDMKRACKDYILNPSQVTLDRLEDLDAELAQEAICLTRGTSIGLSPNCQSKFKDGHDSLFDKNHDSDLDELPSNKTLKSFNDVLKEHCARRNETRVPGYQPVGQGVVFVETLVRFMDCVCEGRQDCGHMSYKTARAFQDDFVLPVAESLEKELEEGRKTEQLMSRSRLGSSDAILISGDPSFTGAQGKDGPYRTMKRAKRALSFSDFIQKVTKFASGCKIELNPKLKQQSFSCSFIKFLKITITVRFRPKFYGKIELKFCIPYLSMVTGVLSKIPGLQRLEGLIGFKKGCVVLLSASIDFERGVFQVEKHLGLPLIGIKFELYLRLLFRFDTKKPENNAKERNRLNKYGDRKYVALRLAFEVRHFTWNHFSGEKWKCLYCKTLADKSWTV